MLFSMLFLLILCVMGRRSPGGVDAIRVKAKVRDISKNPTRFCSADQDSPNRHVVFYGGTFDPPTLAHLEVASQSLKARIHVDCVWFSPTYHPYYKPNKAHHKIREEMISMSFGMDSEKMSLSLAYEKSYTVGMDIQTMDYNAYLWLEKEYPQTKFSLVVGEDSLTPQGPYTFEGWRDILKSVARKKGHILVLDRGSDMRNYENMLLYMWQVNASPFVHVNANMSAFSKVSSSGIRNLLLSVTDGEIDAEMRGKLSKAGLSEPLVEYLATNRKLVQQYSGAVAWKHDGAFLPEEEEPKADPLPESPSDSSFCSTERDLSNRHVVFYGGTFDPPTVAHMKVASEALKSGIGGINCVWLSPIYHPDYKPKKTYYLGREHMLSWSFDDEKDAEKMKVSKAYELSYRIGMDIQRMDYRAFRWLEINYPQTKFSMVVGADSLTPQGPYTLEGWRDILRRVARSKGYILVLDRETQSSVTAFQDMLLKQWDVSPSPFRPLSVDMSAYMKVSSSGIRNLMLEAEDGEIDYELFRKLIDAGLAESLVGGYLCGRRSIVRKYAGQVSWAKFPYEPPQAVVDTYHKSFLDDWN